MAQTGVVNIRGKDYQTVALRVQKFREVHPDWEISTEIIKADDTVVIIKAGIYTELGKCIAIGHAEEFRASSQINSTSALENCETSAIGRALAAAGWGGAEFASANEVQNAIHQQNSKPLKSEEELLIAVAKASNNDDLSKLWKTLTPTERNLIRDAATIRSKEFERMKDA